MQSLSGTVKWFNVPSKISKWNYSEDSKYQYSEAKSCNKLLFCIEKLKTKQISSKAVFGVVC